jgi:hypothetical protein
LEKQEKLVSRGVFRKKKTWNIQLVYGDRRTHFTTPLFVLSNGKRRRALAAKSPYPNHEVFNPVVKRLKKKAKIALTAREGTFRQHVRRLRFCGNGFNPLS